MQCNACIVLRHRYLYISRNPENAQTDPNAYYHPRELEWQFLHNRVLRYLFGSLTDSHCQQRIPGLEVGWRWRLLGSLERLSFYLSIYERYVRGDGITTLQALQALQGGGLSDPKRHPGST